MPTLNHRNFSADYWMIPATFLACFAIFYFNMPPLFSDPDIGWRLANGAWILQNHSVPANDKWSFASTDANWVNPSWLWDFVLGVVDLVGGLFGVLVFVAGFTAACMAFLCSRLLWLGLRRPAIILTLIAATTCMTEFLTFNSELGGFALLLLFHALLHETRTTWRCGRMLMLPPLMMIWSNLHDNFLVGFTLMAAYLIEALFSRHYSWAINLLFTAAACAGFALLTPYGVDTMQLRMETLMHHIYDTSTPFTFTADFAVSLWMLMFVLASNIRAPHAGIADRLIAMFWLVVTLFTTHSAIIFVLVSVPYLAACFDDQARGLRNMRPPSSLRKYLSHIPSANLWFICFLMTVGFIFNAEQQPHAHRLQPAATSAADAIDYMTKNQPKRSYLVEARFGSELVYRTRGKIAYFMDSRGERAYSEQAMNDYSQLIKLKEGWPQLLKIYGIDAMLLSGNTEFARAYEKSEYRKSWQLVFAGKTANVYIARP